MFRRLGPVVVLVTAALLAPSAQGVQSVGPGYTASFQVSYDSPPFPDARLRVTTTFEGEVCGDPSSELWDFLVTRTGIDDAPPPGIASFSFAGENPALVTSDTYFVDGTEVGKIEYLLRFTPGRPPVLTPEWRVTGDIQNVVATPPQLTATAQTLADCPAAPPPPPPAPPGSVATGIPSGTVLVNGTRYVSGRPISYGSRIDVTNGRLVLETELGTVTVYGGGISAAFRLVRLREPSDMIGLYLVGGNLKTCANRSLATTGQSQKPVRRLWAKGKGKFQTKGRYASAAVRGTWWLTEDTCTSTLVRVRQGSVTVRDIPKKKTVIVKAPNTYSAQKPRR